MNKIFNSKTMMFWLYFVASLIIMSSVMRLTGVAEWVITGKGIDEHDQHYANHLWLTLVHLIPGTLFILLGPLQFSTSIRRRWPRFHRWSGRVFLFCGLFTAISALIMNAIFPPVGGIAKAILVVIFSIYEIAALLIAWRSILKRNIFVHRNWMIRAYAIGLAVSTARFFFIPYFIFFGMPTETVIDVGMWFSFLLNCLIAEIIIHKLRKQHA